MIREKLFEATRIPMLVKGLDAYALRHRAISDNVVNSEPPHFKRREVLFEEKLKAAINRNGLTRTSDRHLGKGGIRLRNLKPELQLDQTSSDVNDVNNVDIDEEMGAMARNQLQFSFASRMTKIYFEMLKSSIIGM